MREQHFWHHPIVWSIVLINVAILLLRFFEYVLIDRLTIFLLPMLWLLMLAAVVLSLLVAIGFWIYSAKKGLWQTGRFWKGALPLVIQLVAIGLMVFVPWSDLWLTLNFQQHLGARQQAIEFLRSQQTLARPELVQLPAAYQQTTLSDGEVQLFSTNGDRYVLFFTLRAIDTAAGFVYSESGKPPVMPADSAYEIQQQRQIQPQWYYVNIGERTDDL